MAFRPFIAALLAGMALFGCGGDSRSGAAGSDGSQTPAPEILPGEGFVATTFGFYYPDDLIALEQAGAELVSINTLTDASLPAVDGLFIGGGFPETRMQELSANTAMREQIRTAIDAGLPAYAECGGLMYLCRSLRWQGRQYEMAGVIPADCVMHARPQGRGYVRLRETAAMPSRSPPEPTTRSSVPCSSATFAIHRAHCAKPGGFSSREDGWSCRPSGAMRIYPIST